MDQDVLNYLNSDASTDLSLVTGYALGHLALVKDTDSEVALAVNRLRDLARALHSIRPIGATTSEG